MTSEFRKIIIEKASVIIQQLKNAHGLKNTQIAEGLKIPYVYVGYLGNVKYHYLISNKTILVLADLVNQVIVYENRAFVKKNKSRPLEVKTFVKPTVNPIVEKELSFWQLVQKLRSIKPINIEITITLK